MWCVTEPYVSLPWPSSFAASARTFDAVGSIATSLTVGARSDSGVRTMLTYTSQNWVHWDSTAARSAASPAGSSLSVPAVGLGLVTTELCGTEAGDPEAGAAVDVAVDDADEGSSVSMLTPEADVQPPSRTPAMASDADIAADLRPNMNAPRDAADTVSDCG